MTNHQNCTNVDEFILPFIMIYTPHCGSLCTVIHQTYLFYKYLLRIS